MEFLSELWKPIVLSGVFAWIASFLIHMVLPLHKGEWKGLPDEGKLAGALEGVAPGQYMFPFGSMADMKSPEFQERMKRGPVGTLMVRGGPVNMARNVVLMLVFFLVVAVFVAYVGSHTLAIGELYRKVFQVCGAMAFMAYGLGWMPNMLWYGGSTKAFWVYLLDSAIYSLITAGTFAALWPR